MSAGDPGAESAMSERSEKTTSPLDIAGWIVLAWVVVCSAAYFHSAVVPRFPWLLGWVERIF